MIIIINIIIAVLESDIFATSADDLLKEKVFIYNSASTLV